MSLRLKTLVAITALSMSAFAQGPVLPALGPYSAATNFTIDLSGIKDVRPGTWGDTGVVQNQVTFYPPVGYRVRIIRVYGDFVAWPKSGVMAPEAYSEVGFSLMTSAPGGSSRVSFSADDCFLWIQNAVLPGNPSPRAPFDFKLSHDVFLAADNVLISQMFVALNTSGLTIHMEPTFVVIYQFEPL